MIDWEIRGPAFVNCNCDFGCPCQFSAPPTYKDCRALSSMRIEEGDFGGVSLDGLCWVNTLAWPGAIHEGNGTHQSIIDERADERQRHALTEILHGRESKEGANIFAVFASTMTTVLDPLFKPIEFECDMDKRTARVMVPGLVETKGEPIRNPVSGEEHRCSIGQPEGFEYLFAEMGSGTTQATGDVKLDLNNSYGQFSIYHMTNKGVVR